jgi:succinyl-diaminopimelate desuccinylase
MSSSGALDPIELTRALIRRPSVTPRDAGALDVLQQALEALGFTCTRLPFGEGAARVDNLYASIGQGRPHFMFAGHTDVVPPGDEAAWDHKPFDAAVAGGMLVGRGAADMKSAIAAFTAAVAGHLDGGPKGTISLLITGDEEGDAINGTRAVLGWMGEQGIRPDHCLVGEPTSAAILGDTVKIGRRGSLTVKLTVTGRQGHVAYPDRAQNPVHALLPVLARLAARRLDEGTEFFSPSSLQITSIDVGNPATNVIPATVTAGFNIRYNDLHTAQSLTAWIEEELATIPCRVEQDIHVSSDAFRAEPGDWTRLVGTAVQAVTGQTPEFTTGGGTSDARFIKDICPVVEFGLVGDTMHQVNERVPVADVRTLSAVYRHLLDRYFDTMC